MRRKKILKMKLLLIFVSFIFCAAVDSWLLPSSTEGSCLVNDISLEKVDNFTKLTIYADKPFEFIHSSLEEKDGKPYRVIIDCKDAVFNLPQHDFKEDLPSGTIKAIRTSQFQTEPEKIVRVVLDLDKPAIYKVVEKGDGKRGAIAILTAQDPSFPFWAAVQKEAPKAKLASFSFVDKNSEEKSEAKNNILTSPEDRSRFDLKQSQNVKGEEMKKRATFERRLSFADTSEINTEMKISQVYGTEQGSEKKETKVMKKSLGQISEKVALASSGTSPQIFSTPEQKDKILQSEQPEKKKIETDVEKETHADYSPKSSSSEESPSSGQEKISSIDEVKQAVKEWSEKKKTAYMSPTVNSEEERIQKDPLLSQKEAIPLAGEAKDVIKELPEENKTDSLKLTAQEEKIALLSPEEKSTTEKAGTPESLVIISKPPGTVLDVVPKREIIHYHGEGRRDPFVALTERISTEFGEIPLPTFESLKLVGVLRDEAGNRALLEDENGYGYIMKSGDKIKNGFVVSVEDNKIIFQIEEYGWSKTMTLELPN